MKVICTTGTTLRGKPLNAGDVIDLDVDTIRILGKDVKPYVEQPKQLVEEEQKTAKQKGK